MEYYILQEDDQYDYDAGEKESSSSPKPDQAPPPVPETTPIQPTRVVPTLLSPSFDDPASVDEPTLSMTAKPIDADDDLVQPTAVFSEPPKIYSSVLFPVNSYFSHLRLTNRVLASLMNLFRVAIYTRAKHPHREP